MDEDKPETSSDSDLESGKDADGSQPAGNTPGGPIPVALVPVWPSENGAGQGNSDEEGADAPEHGASAGDNAASRVYRSKNEKTEQAGASTEEEANDELDNLLKKLAAIPSDDWTLLIIGFSDAGKSFFVDQAKTHCKQFFDAGEAKELVPGIVRRGGGSGSTKAIERSIFTRNNESDDNSGRTCNAPTFHLIDIPGEWFGRFLGLDPTKDPSQQEVNNLLALLEPDNVQLRQLMATVALADAMIFVINGPAALHVRTRRAPEKIGDEIGEIAEEDWERLTASVSRSLDALGPLSSFLRVVSEQRTSGISKVAAYRKILSMNPEAFEHHLTRPGALCPTPLFVTMTKADQVFGFGSEERAEVSIRSSGAGKSVTLLANDPWISLLRANAKAGERRPYSSIVGRYRTVNLDYSAASPGGAKTFADANESAIPVDYRGHGRGIEEAVYWLLDELSKRPPPHETSEGGGEHRASGFGTGLAGWLRRWFTRSGLRASPRVYSSAISRRLDFDREFRNLAWSKRS